MDREKHPRIGKLGRPWGRDGELLAEFPDVELEDLPASGWIFISINRQFVPFHYASLKHNNRVGALIQFDDLDARQTLAELVGLPLHATPEMGLQELKPTEVPEELIGYLVQSMDGKEVGTVTGMEGNELNPVLAVNKEGKEVLIPFADGIVLAVDHDQRTISVSLPAGLLDL